MGKQTSNHPYRGPRQRQMPSGADPVAPGRVRSIPDGGPDYRLEVGRTQAKDRSLGFRRVKTRPQEKGV